MAQLLMRVAITILMSALFLAFAGSAQAETPKEKRLAAHGYPQCSTWKCAAKVKKQRARKQRLALRREMQGYKKNPMPWCTWGPESGVSRGQWSLARYRQPNVSGGTGGGKFQFLTSTWYAIGGGRFASQPHYAAPVYQERMARVLLRVQGLGAWVNC